MILICEDCGEIVRDGFVVSHCKESCDEETGECACSGEMTEIDALKNKDLIEFIEAMKDYISDGVIGYCEICPFGGGCVRNDLEFADNAEDFEKEIAFKYGCPWDIIVNKLKKLDD